MPSKPEHEPNRTEHPFHASRENGFPLAQGQNLVAAIFLPKPARRLPYQGRQKLARCGGMHVAERSFSQNVKFLHDTLPSTNGILAQLDRRVKQAYAFLQNLGCSELAKKQKETTPESYLVGYARVSTKEQNLDLQLNALRKAGVKEDNLHVEKLSATSKKRPALDLAIKDLREGDTLVVWRLDRFVRSIRDLYARLDQIKAKGARFRSLTENFDFNTFMGEFVLVVLAAVAQLERQILAYRTAAGIEAWKERGEGKWGRAASLNEEQIVEAGQMLNRKKNRMTGPQVADHFDVSPPTVYKHWKRNRSGRGGRRFIRQYPKN